MSQSPTLSTAGHTRSAVGSLWRGSPTIFTVSFIEAISVARIRDGSRSAIRSGASGHGNSRWPSIWNKSPGQREDEYSPLSLAPPARSGLTLESALRSERQERDDPRLVCLWEQPGGMPWFSKDQEGCPTELPQALGRGLGAQPAMAAWQVRRLPQPQFSHGGSSQRCCLHPGPNSLLNARIAHQLRCKQMSQIASHHCPWQPGRQLSSHQHHHTAARSWRDIHEIQDREYSSGYQSAKQSPPHRPATGPGSA